MIYLEEMTLRRVTQANYVTSVNGMIHPDRIMAEHDFLYMLDGSWEICEEGQVYEMNRDDLLILAAKRHHFGQRLCNPGNRHMYIHAQPTEAEQSMDNMEKCTPFPSLIHCGKNPRIRQYFHEIIAAYWAQTAQRDNRLSLLFSLLLCELSASLTDSAHSPLSDPMVEEISRKIHSTPQVFFSAKEIAADYFICERTLNNRFLKIYGKTFYAWQMETKLEMVRQYLLTQPQAKLHEAAVNYGFYDEFHLSKAFKRQFGQSPSSYRKERSVSQHHQIR